MKCPFCFSGDTYVVDSRLSQDGMYVRRRRQCTVCKKRFSTLETLEYHSITVIKKSGKKEAFSEDKLERSINVELYFVLASRLVYRIEKTDKND